MNRASRYLANVTFLTFARVVVVAFWVCICHHATPGDSKVFERCELAQLLRYGHGLDVNDVANWVCIAQHSSSLNTSAFGGDARSGSHGIFQISDQYWCSPPGKGVACGLTCDRLRDDDISDDLACVRMIYEEHQRLSGDGYNAWNAYQPYCRENPYEYVEDCFGNEEREYLHSKSITANYIEDEQEEEDYDKYSKKRGKVYGRCELAKELFLKHKMPMEEIPTWVCIAQHESNYDTSAVGRLNTDGSADHGLFQISDLYWCSHKGGRRKACGLPCSKLLDADITDDVKCVKQIYKEHSRISGDGFTAWTVYNAYCHSTTASYTRGCFDGIDVEDTSASEEHRVPAKPSKGGKKKPRGKIYEPCELADELRNKHALPEDQIATWVCIAKHESDYNTSAIGYGDHGLFQISDIYWCSPPGKGFACGLSCADLEDSDISDDVQCIRKIFDEHTHLSGDGFNAWTVYPQYCSEGRSEKYISHCPSAGKRPTPAVTAPSPTYSKLPRPNSIEEYEPKNGKVYGRCELAEELLTKHEMSMDDIPTWVCIAHHESNFDTSAVGRLNTDGSADHGLFQISDLYWCSHKEGHRKACGLPCTKLLDNDITDDVRCVKQIHNEHTRISGDGFTAWTVYNAYCKERTEEYIRGCFDGTASVEDFTPTQRTTDYGHLPKNKPKGKIYDECELANELRDKHSLPKDQISTWVCIAQHQSGLNTSSAVSNVHGMFHISDEFWCSPPGKGKVCELHCSDLEDSDITDDVECIRKIYLEHQRLFGNGFSAWVVYDQHCSDGRADNYIGHCPGFESPITNSIFYRKQPGIIKVHPKLGGKSIELSNLPVYDHVFKANPFLKHFELVNSDAASQFFSHPAEESFSASEEVDDIIPSSHAYSLNPFLKTLQMENKPEKTKEVTIDTTTTSLYTRNEEVDDIVSANHEYTLNPFLKSLQTEEKSSFEQEKTKDFPIKTMSSPPFMPIAPTPTTSKRLQTYQPQNEEHAKYEAFKEFATPSLPATTQTPRANRLQTYQLNNFKSFNTFATPSLAPPPATHPPTTNHLQPYQLNTLNNFQTIATPTTQPLNTKISSLKPLVLPPLPTVQGKSSSKPYSVVTTSIRTPLTSVSQDSGQYVPGIYDSGRYDPKKYNPPKMQPAVRTTTTNSRTESASAALKSGQYPVTTPTLQAKAPSSIRFTTTGSYGLPIVTSAQRTEQTSSTGFPSTSINSGRYEPFKPFATPTLTTKLPLSLTIASTSTSSSKFDPFKPFSTSTLQPIGTTTSFNKFDAYKAGNYFSYKPSTTSKDSGQYFPNKSLVTPSLPTKPSSASGFKATTSPTKKYDPFRPFGENTRTYDPFQVFNAKQKTSPFTFLSAESTSSNELDFAPSSNSKRETMTLNRQQTNSTGDFRTSTTSKRETMTGESSTGAETTSILSGSSSSKEIEPIESISSISEQQQEASGTIEQTKSETGSASTVESTSSSSTTKAAVPTGKTTSRAATSTGSLELPTTTRSVAGTSPTTKAVSETDPAKSTLKSTSKPVTSTRSAAGLSSTSSRIDAAKLKPPTSTRSFTGYATSRSVSPTLPSRSRQDAVKSTASITSKPATLTRSFAGSSSSRSVPALLPTTKSVSRTDAAKPTASKPATSTRSVATKTLSATTRSVSRTDAAKSTARITSKTATPTRSFAGSFPSRSAEALSPTTKSVSRTDAVKRSAVVTSKPAALSVTAPVPSRPATTRSAGTSGAIRPTSTVTTKPSLPVASQIRGRITRSTETKSASVDTPESTSTSTTTTPTESPAAPTTTISSTTSNSLIATETTKSTSATTTTNKLDDSPQFTAPPTRSTTSSLSKTSIRPTATVTSSKPSLAPTIPQSRKSLNPTKVARIPTKSPTRPQTTSRRPSTATISPTKSHRSSESLFSTKLNIYDLYFKLYGVHPPIKTSSGVQQATKTTQTNVILPSRTS